MPVLIYPNPLNPKRYVVLNSGFTFREYDYLNNARQVPKLPDFAVVDVDVPVIVAGTGRHRDGGVLHRRPGACRFVNSPQGAQYGGDQGRNLDQIVPEVCRYQTTAIRSVAASLQG